VSGAKVAAAVAAASVAAVRPALLRDREASLYLGHKGPSWIRAKRAADQAALRAGQPTTGPRWVILGGKSVFYRLADLDAWIAANSEECGTVPFANRGGAR